MFKKTALIVMLTVLSCVIGNTAHAQFEKFQLPQISPPQFTPPQLTIPNPLAELQRRLGEARRRIEYFTRYSSNKSAVRNSLSRGGYYVAYGKEISFKEYYDFTKAVGASVATSNPGPAYAYLKYYLIECKRELSRSLQTQSQQFFRDLERDLLRAMNQSLQSKRPVRFNVRGIHVEVGLATYNNWKSVSWHEPYIAGHQIRFRYQERRIPLPNRFQPYVKFRLN